jgi:cytochrome c oxidase assembly factor CtaG
MWMPSAAPDLLRLVRWHPQPIPVVPVLCLLLAAAYAWGVVHLRRSGHSWSPGRCVSWAAGLATILAVTATGVGGYSMELFSVHMAQHMVLSMLSPLLLVMAAPLTLALRALPARGGAAGLRRVLLVLLHSRAASALTAPALTLPLFIVSLYGLYFTPLFDAAMGSWFWHDWMLLHFVAVGLLLFWPILAIDPSPRTTSPVLRIIELFMAMPFHAFFGIAVMTSTTLLVRTFALPYPPWRTGALADQHLGGGIAWAFSEIPTLLVVAVILVRWSRSSDREARRLDRAASRDGDKALLAYNAWLARLAALDRGDGGGNPA